MKAKVICIEGYWRLPPGLENGHERFEHRCVVMPKGATDSMATEVLKDINGSLGFQDGIFYVFGEDDHIVGYHNHFVVDFCNPLYEIDMGELQ